MSKINLKGLDYFGSAPIDEIGSITGMESGHTLLLGAEELIADYLKMDSNLEFYTRKKGVLGIIGKEFISPSKTRGYVFLGRLHGSIKKGGDYTTLVGRVRDVYSSQGKEIVAVGKNTKDESMGFAWRKK